MNKFDIDPVPPFEPRNLDIGPEPDPASPPPAKPRRPGAKRWFPSAAEPDRPTTAADCTSGRLDEVTRFRISGWARDAARPGLPVQLRIFDNGMAIADVTADRYRPDLAANGIGDGCHGFELMIPAGLSPLVPHVVSVQRGRDGMILANSPLQLAAGLNGAAAAECSAPAAAESLLGFLDTATHDRVAGWAYDRFQPDEPVALLIFDNGVPLARVLADHPRRDLEQVGIGRGSCGFDFAIPGGLSPLLRHVISVRRERDGVEIGNAPMTIEPAVELAGMLSGARLLTAGGPVPVEALVEGELVITASGAVVPVRWLGKERIDLRAHPRPASVWPVRISKGALGGGKPHADLLLAPGQCLLIDDVPVPAGLLVNGATIVSEQPPDMFACFHVELAAADALLAEGAPVASYQDSGRRLRACNGAFPPAPASPRPAPDAAVTGGPALARIRQRLHTIAETHMFRPSRLPRLRLRVGQTDLPGEPCEGGEWRFALPAGTAEMQLCSRSFIAAWVSPGSADPRRLGVAVSRLTLIENGHARELKLADLPPAGWHPCETQHDETWRWTDGAARLCCPPTGDAVVLSVTVRETATYWTRPDDADEPAGAPIEARRAVRRIVFISGEPHTPGHIYRVLRPLQAARQLGLQASWMALADIAGRSGEIGEADVVVIWRAPDGPALSPAIAAARRAGARILFDLDDLMVDPSLARPEVIDALRLDGCDPAAVKTLYEGIRAAAGAASGCLATTDELAAHLRQLHRPVWVLPNGFDEATWRASRRAVRRREAGADDGLLRIGYAGGTRTHQRDLRPVARALARLLRERPLLRLVLFRESATGTDLVDIAEYPALTAVADRIEWREMVPLAGLPSELARFDINLAPLEAGNLFCEAKSELKFFEAALVEVCTVATPTGPFRRAIRDGKTGFFATTPNEWYAVLQRLLDDPPLRRKVAGAAYHDVLWRHGPERRAELLSLILAQQGPARVAAQAFELATRRSAETGPPLLHLPDAETIYAHDHLREADVTVIVPLYNYAQYVIEALDSVRQQNLATLDLVVVDDASTDTSLEVVTDWVDRHAGRFNRLLVLRNRVNAGLSLARNRGFAAAETPYVLPLDADNRLLPQCLSVCLQHLRARPGAAFAYPGIRQFGETAALMGEFAYTPMQLAGGNYIDAMALIAKSAWVAVGGYQPAVVFGWEDYDLWCCMAERGLWGCQVDAVLAEYRVHAGSMLRTVTDRARNKRRLVEELHHRHPWLAVRETLAVAAAAKRAAGLRSKQRK